MADYQKTTYPKTERSVIQDPKLKMYQKNRQGKWATLNWSYGNNNNPIINVYTGLDEDRDKDAISARFDNLQFTALITMLEDAIRFKPTEQNPEFMESTECKTPRKGTSDVFRAALVKVGKNKEGVVWIMVSVHGREDIVFYFTNGKFYDFLSKSGDRKSDAEVSVRMARSYVKLLESILLIMMMTKFNPEVGKKKQDGQSGGYQKNQGNSNYQQKQNYQNNNQQQQNAPKPDAGGYEDDIPFN